MNTDSKPLVSEIQLEMLRQQGAMCHFRHQDITVHEVMIAAELLGDTMGEFRNEAGLTLALKCQGFKGKQLHRMLSAQLTYVKNAKK